MNKELMYILQELNKEGIQIKCDLIIDYKCASILCSFCPLFKEEEEIPIYLRYSTLIFKTANI